MAGVAVEGELRYREGRPADIRERPLHLARLLEDAEAGDLGGKAFAVFGTVVRADPEENHDTGFDIDNALVADVDAGGTNALNHRAR
jgi:hypothetical protein